MSNQTRTDDIYVEGRSYTNLTILMKNFYDFFFYLIPNFVRTVGPSKFRDQQIPPSPEVGG